MFRCQPFGSEFPGPIARTVALPELLGESPESERTPFSAFGGKWIPDVYFPRLQLSTMRGQDRLCVMTWRAATPFKSVSVGG